MEFVIQTAGMGQLVFEDIGTMYNVEVKGPDGVRIAKVQISKADIKRLAKAS